LPNPQFDAVVVSAELPGKLSHTCMLPYAQLSRGWTHFVGNHIFQTGFTEEVWTGALEKCCADVLMDIKCLP